MVFSSLLFLFMFLPVFLGLYFLVPQKLKNLVLFIASLFFYAWGEPIYVLIMIFSTVLDYSCGLFIAHFREHKWLPKMGLMVSIVANLSLLGFFKYSDFLVTTLNTTLGTHLSLLKLALPIGISFYTFQTMSYTIDLYRGKIQVQKNIISFGAYVAMFPQLIAGPIVTYATVEKELNSRTTTWEKFGEGSLRFIEGLGKKVLIANNVGRLWETVKGTAFHELSLLGAWLGIIAFALQLYFDFSGYSDMAIGLGKMMGFHFPENFNYPYISKSVSEFWRRWHITLGSWFREYVYFPLGGSRVTKSRFYFNLIVVWFLTGFWHGAGWNFILWGLFFGILMIIERRFLLRFLDRLPVLFSHLYLLVAVLISWVFFSLNNLTEAFQYLKVMFGFGKVGLLNTPFLYQLTNYVLILMLALLLATPLMHRLKKRLPDGILYIFYMGILLLSTAYLVDSTFNPFLYFRF